MPDIYIDVGHSAASAGAVGFDGRTEHAEGLELAHMLAPELKRLGITYQMDLSGNDPAYRGSVNRANAAKASLALELHRDWRGGVDSCFGLFVSKEGERFSLAMTEALRERGLPIYKDGAINEDEIGRHGLAFLNDTTMPAVIIELGRIRNFPAARNRTEAKGLAAGIAKMLGKVAPAPPQDTKEHRDVAVGAVRRPDTVLAAQLGWAHGFAFVVPLPDGRWLQTYPDGRKVIVDSVGYLVGVGYEAEELIQEAGDGVVVRANTANLTGIEVGKLVRQDNVDRMRPFR